MIIVIAIIGIITVVVIVSQGSFNKSLILSNAAYDMALALRSTESYGISSRLSGPTATYTHIGYGIEFTVGNSFTFFSDNSPAQPSSCHPAPANGASAPDAKWGDCVYTAAADAIINLYGLNRGITISDICAYAGATRYCASASTLTRLDIVFIRPDPAPYMSINGAYSASNPITSACITILAPTGDAKRYVSVASTGEINANAAPCP